MALLGQCSSTIPRIVSLVSLQAFKLASVRLSNLQPSTRSQCTFPPAAPQPPTQHTLQRTFTADDVAAFTSLTGDANPLHTQGVTSVVPGLLLASLFPAIIGTKYPGARYLKQEVRFRHPVVVGSIVEAHVVLQRASGSRSVFVTRCLCKGEVVVEGVALAMMPPSGEGGTDNM